MDKRAVSGERAWSEADSEHFIARGEVYTPERDRIQDAILSLIPVQDDEAFLAVELGVGDGWLSAAILERFAQARVSGLDGSPAMLQVAANRLTPFAGRFDLRIFQLEDLSWLDALDGEVRCVVSSLVVHHLDGAGKRALYRRLYERLTPGGALLLADLLAPNSAWERRSMARQWDAVVQRQSLSLTGTLEAHRQFVAERWNIYDYPDPMDLPSTGPEHLRWLSEAGFTGVNVFWADAGHAVYGGYKTS